MPLSGNSPPNMPHPCENKLIGLYCRPHTGRKSMTKGWKILIVGVLLIAGLSALGLYNYQNQLFKMGPLRSRLLENLPVAGAARFRQQTIEANGALCGEVAGVSGGERIGDGPGGNAAITSIPVTQWRRFVVAPSVPAFYVQGLAPWALSMDGKRIAVDQADMDQQRSELTEQYDKSAQVDRISPDRTQQELTIKTLNEHFETVWAQYCPAHS